MGSIYGGQKAPNYPPSHLKNDVGDWIEAVSEDPWKTGSFQVTHFGQLGQLTKRSGGKPAHFERLVKTTQASADEKKLLFAASRLLTMTIRNRDAHAYVPNVRDSHCWIVHDVFMPALNLLVKWIPNGGGQRLRDWRSTTSQFIHSLT